jgi:hypothetical protein
MPDRLHPLVRRRKILVEAFDQVAQVLDFYHAAEWDTRALEADLRRIHLRLIQTQQEIEENDLD